MATTDTKKRNARTTLRVDQFEVAVQLAENFACGGVSGEFRATCRISARQLTAEGFVIEVGEFMQRVRNAFDPSCGIMFKASCEEPAAGVVNIAAKAIGDRLEEIVVEVENLTGSVEVVWQSGDEVPAFPRRATDAERQRTEEARSRPGYQEERPSAC